MSGICDTCRREHCSARWDGMKSCDFYAGGETRYERLLGTPERAARTLREISVLHCEGCVVSAPCKTDCERPCLLNDYDALLEWLRGDAE